MEIDQYSMRLDAQKGVDLNDPRRVLSIEPRSVLLCSIGRVFLHRQK